jgi:hypothetical protein
MIRELLNVLVFVLTLQYWAGVRVLYDNSCRSGPMARILGTALSKVRAPARQRNVGEKMANKLHGTQ